MNNYKDKRLLEMLDYLDPKFIEEAGKYYKHVPVRGIPSTKSDPKKQIKYIVALAACLLMLGAFIPMVTYIIQNRPYIGGIHETTGGDTTLAPEITSEEITSSPEPESSAPETTEPEPTHETTEPLYDGTTAPREETSAPEETTAEETTADETTAEETTAVPEPEHDGSYGLKYRVDGNRAVLVGIGTCTDTDIVIASKYNGVPVTEIGDSAFLGCSGIKSVLIPESVTSIGAHAFSLCEGLESVNIPNKVTSIETYAFHACKSLKVIDIGNVTKIDDFAFTMCENLEMINFGKSLQSIGYQAFFHCSSLKELTLPDSLTTIGDWAFDCSSLRRVSVGKNIKKIGESAFLMCSELSEFVYRGTRESWKSVTLGEDWKSRQITLIKCSDGDIDLNAPPEHDGSRGLVYQLSKDKKSASLVGIGTCTDKNIVIASTFGGVPVVSVAEGVFKDNANITGIHIPASVTALNGLFYNCQNVKSLTVDPDHPSFYSAGNCIIDKQSKTILVGCNGSVIPTDGSILRIGTSSFDGCNGITELTIPDGVLIIYDYAFDNCINLGSVKIPDSVTKINSAFNGCTSLRKVELPSEMEWVGGFSGCTSLREITLPKTGKLSSGAFKDCTALESVTVPSGTTSLNSTFEGCISLKSVILPDTLTSISKSSFLNCKSLESITIPKGVTELNDAAFNNCPKLLTVNFAGTAEEWRSIFKATDWNRNCNFSAVHCSDGDATP